MSYILEALRRAESERQRGQVPGLGAAPLPAADAAGPVSNRHLLWAALGLAALGLTSASVWWLQRSATAPAGVASDAALTVPVLALRPPKDARTATGSTAAAVPAPAQTQLASVAASSPPAVPALPALPKVVSAPPAATPAPGPAPAPALSSVDPATDRRTLKLAELTPLQRSEWPALAVGGSVWSDSAASRFVILNGQVLREGQALLPGLVLERIEPKSALMRWRGLLVELPL